MESTGINPQQGMPASTTNRLKEPAAIEAVIRRDNDRPCGRDCLLKDGDQRFPMRSPRTRGGCANAVPSNGNRATAIDDTDGQHGDGLAQGCGIQDEDDAAIRRRPPCPYPTDERGKDGDDIKGRAMRPRLAAAARGNSHRRWRMVLAEESPRVARKTLRLV